MREGAWILLDVWLCWSEQVCVRSGLSGFDCVCVRVAIDGEALPRSISAEPVSTIGDDVTCAK